MKQIIITVPDDMSPDGIADYVDVVAQQIRDAYVSGHITVDHHWISEGRL